MSLPERIIQGRYRVIYAIDEQHGVAVFCCRDDHSGGLVYVAEWTTSDPASQQQLADNASHISAINDAHGVLLPLIAHSATETGYMAVCTVPGGHDLSQTVRMRNGALSPAEVTTQTIRLLTLVDQLNHHQPALFLGTLTPYDVVVADDGLWKLTPFALMRTRTTHASPYRAPELVNGGALSAASDVYAVAGLAYYASTGVAPLTAEVLAGGAKFVSARTLNPQLSEMFEQVLLRGLQEKIANRYQSAAEMQISLETIATLGNRSTSINDMPVVNVPPVASDNPSPVASNAIPSAVLPGNYQEAPPVVNIAPGASSNVRLGCLVAVAITLTLLAIMLCIVLLLIIPGSPWRSVLGDNFVSSFNFAVTTSTPAPSPTSKAIVAAIPTSVPTVAASNRVIDTSNVANLQVGGVITSTAFGPAAWSPDGQNIAIAAGDIVSIHEAVQFSETEVFRGHVGNITTLSWSPDSRWLASGANNDSIIHIWDVTNNSEVMTLRGHDGWIRSLAFSPDGQYLASGSTDLSIRIWDIAQQQTVAVLTGHTDLVGGLAWSADSQILASASRDGSVRQWDARTGNEVVGFSFTTPANPDDPNKAPYWATGLVWSRDSDSLYVGATSGLITQINATSGSIIRTLQGHSSWITIRGLQLSSDGSTLYSAGLDGRICVWDTASGTQTASYQQHELSIFGITLDPLTARLISTSDQEGRLLIWDLANEQILGTFRVGQGIPTGIRYALDGTVLASTGYNGAVRLHQIDRQEDLFLAGYTGVGQDIAFLGTNRFAMITAEDTLSLYTPESQTPQTLQGLIGRPLSIAASHDGKFLAVGSSETIQIWRGDTVGTSFTLQTTLKDIRVAEFAHTSNMLAVVGAGEKPGYELWDVTARTLVWHSDDAIYDIDFMSDGAHVVVLTADNVVEIRAFAADTAVRTIKSVDPNGFAVVKALPADNLIVTANFAGVLTFYADSGQSIAEISQEDGITAIGVNPTGSEIAVGNRDGSITRYVLP